MIAGRSVMAVIAPLRSRCSICLDVRSLSKRLLIGQKYYHAANMNSESAKELLKWRNSALITGLHTRQARVRGYSLFQM